METTTAAPKVRVYGVEYPFLMPGDLTLGELADAEGITGQGYDLETGGYKAFLALAYLSVRRVDGRFTVEEARSLVGDEIEFIRPEGADVEVPPESSADSTSSGGNSDDLSQTGSGLHRVPTHAATGGQD